MAFEAGHSKIGGRIKGVPNRNTIELRTMLREALEKEVQNLPQYLDSITDTKMKIELLIKLMPYVFPKMQTIDLVDAKEKDPLEWI
ncbi:MAG: hypothetical protein C5B59_18460 [Bacteroidetes bacterium]|nr:MAG: hypothetical protein C5B59_18460 [Bacteroidota bacterium]